MPKSLRRGLDHWYSKGHHEIDYQLLPCGVHAWVLVWVLNDVAEGYNEKSS